MVNMQNLIKTRFIGTLAVFAVATLFAFNAAKAAEQKQFLTVSISSYSDIVGAGKMIASLADASDGFEVFNMMFGKLDGCDITKPIGITLFSDGESVSPIVFLPITDLEKLKSQLPQIGMILENAKAVSKTKYIYEIPSFSTIILEQKGQWFVVYPEGQEKLVPANPTTLLGGLDKKYNLGFHLSFENTPKELLLGALAPMQLIMAMNNPKSAEQFQVAMDQITKMLDEGKSVIGGYNVDQKTGTISLEVGAEVKSETSLSESIAFLRKAKSNFSGFFKPDQSVAIIEASCVPDETKEINKTTIGNALDGWIENLEYELSEEHLEIATEVIDSIREIANETIDLGESNGAVTWLKTGEIIAGFRIAKGESVGEILKKITDTLVEEHSELKNVYSLEYGSFEGYKLSKMSIPSKILPDSDDLPPALANKSLDMVLAVKDDAICAAVGVSSKKLEDILKKAITDSKTSIPLPKTTCVAVLPFIAKSVRAMGFGEVDPVADKVIASLEKSPETAKFTVTSNIESDTKNNVKIVFDGSIISSIAKAVKVAQEAAMNANLNVNPFMQLENQNANNTQQKTGVNISDYLF